MTLQELARDLGGSIICGSDRKLEGGYAGDFLSFVISRAKPACAWFTIMSNVNVAGVAVLADVGAIVLCDGVVPDQSLLDRAKTEDIAIVCTPMSVYEACKKVGSKL